MNRQSRGSALVAAIVFLVLLATLGGFLMRFSTGQQLESALDVQGSQALFSARAGVDWGLYRALVAGSCSPGGTVAHPWPNPTPATWPTFLVQGYTVTVLCESWAADEGGTAISIYRITATACNQPDGTSGACPNNAPGQGYIERQWQATASNP